MPLDQYDVGDKRRLTVTFYNLSSAKTDPTGITFKMHEPDKTVTSYIYGTDAELLKSSGSTAGEYYVDWTVGQEGRHTFRFEGTGALVAAAESTFLARRSVFV